MNDNKTDYKSAGVDIEAGNEAINLIKEKVKSTHTKEVLTDIGSFGSLYSIKQILSEYVNPVLVQSIDGVGTKTIIARKMKKFNTIGIDLLSACANDILVMGAKPLTFLDYIANDKLNPMIVDKIVDGMAKACKETGVSLVGGETAEMPDTYLPGEHDVVGVITGIVDKDKIITGKSISSGDVLIGLPSNGLHTNGYSLARKIFFKDMNYDVDTYLEGLNNTVGEALLEPHINYTNHVFKLLDAKIKINGIAHITGGGLTENIPRILPNGLSVKIQKGTWPILPIFDTLKNLGNVEENEMYKAFNMGIGMVFIVGNDYVDSIKKTLNNIANIYTIGEVVEGENIVHYY